MKRILRSCVIVALLAPAVCPQVAEQANKGYRTPEGRAQVAKKLEDPHRQADLKPKDVIASLDIRPGITIADIGTGVGIWLPYLVEAVGPAGRVIAEDIAQDFLDKAQARIRSNRWSNVTAVLGTDRNPNLPEGQIDLAFVFEVYHHFDYPAEMLGHIARSLKPDGRLAVGEIYRYRRSAKDDDVSQHVRADRDEFIKEIEDGGYRLLSSKDHGTNQYVLIFKKK
ncbi:MAG TPA: class I SAM-dependent methyltransferase [Bryobacterales bacterium]|nr:class I SAM-dependent methyltransferase [Bryobacterales bacterium]